MGGGGAEKMEAVVGIYSRREEFNNLNRCITNESTVIAIKKASS